MTQRLFSHQRTAFLSGVSLAMFAAVLGFQAPAYAQDAAASEEDDVIVVTGIRAAIESAVATKKSETSIVEVISAEDIGKLPDQSIAESIARLPGIAAQRDSGRASRLSLRGLGPDYTVTTLNGREQVSTNDNRSVEFDQYPSELISSVVVYKTPNASMTAQGIAGTADLRTVRPLDVAKRTIAGSYRYEMNSKDALIGGTENDGNRYSLTYIDKFLDGTLGVALGYAHTESPYQAETWETWGYATAPTRLTGISAGDRVMGGAKPTVNSGNLERDGYTAIVEWAPNDKLHITGDYYHSEFDELRKTARIEFPLQFVEDADPEGGLSSVLSNPKVTNGLVSAGTYSFVNTVLGNYLFNREAEVDNLGLNVEYQINDDWSVEADWNRAEVVRKDLILETTAGTGRGAAGATDTITFTQSEFTNAQFTTTLNYSDFNTMLLTDANGWGSGLVADIGGQAGYVKAPEITDELEAFRFEAKRELVNAPLSAVRFGFNRTERTKDKKGIEGFLSLASGADSAVVPQNFRSGVTDLSFIGIDSGMIAYDALAMYNSGFYRYTENNYPDAVKKTWNVDETVDTFYVMGDIDTELFGVPVVGNAGVQFLNVSQSSTALYSAANDYETRSVSDGDSYKDVLPSINLAFLLPADTQLRFAAATTVTRPRMDEMSAGFTYNSRDTKNSAGYYWEASGGNAKLRPWRANAFDVSVEKYFTRKGYVSLALYYKDLKDFIYDGRTLMDFTGFEPTNGATPADAPRTGVYTFKTNGSGGEVKGAEFTVSVPAGEFVPLLEGFGAIFSAAFNDSAIRPEGATQDYDLPGLSEQVTNTTVYYERYGFQARVSNRYRKDFLGEVPDYANTLESKWVHNESIWDAQLGYQFQDGPAKGLSVFIQGNNLTDEPFFTYDGKGQPEKVLKYEEYGSSYLLGINYRY